MQAIELPKEFQIVTKKRPESLCGYAYLFRNLKEGRAIRFRHPAKDSCGIFITGDNDPSSQLGVSLFREGPNLLNMILFNFITFKVVKRVPMCPKKQRLIFYHEAQATIEMRSLLSLKIIKTYNLLDICEAIQSADAFGELRTSIGMEYITHISSIAMLLGTKIVLIPDTKYKEPPVVVFNAKELDRFRTMIYDTQKRTLMAVALTTILLLEFDNFGVSGMRLLTLDKIEKSSRFMCWNPKEELVVFSQKINFKTENYYIMSYRSSNLTLLATIRDIPTYGRSYDERTETLFFIEDGVKRKVVSSISFKDFNKNFQKGDEPAVLEGEYFTHIPDHETQTDVFHIKMVRNNTLVVKPMPSFDHFSR